MKNSELTLLKKVTDDFEKHSISIKIKRYFTDTQGRLLIGSFVPVALRVKYPFFLFGDFDRQGGYKQSLKLLPPEPGTVYLMSYVNGNGFTSANIVGFSGVNELQQNILTGDIVHVFCDDIQAPTYFVWIVQQNTSVSIASIINNSQTTQKDNRFGKLYVAPYAENERSVVYTTTNNNVTQWQEPFHITKLNNLGVAHDDQFNPVLYETPFTYLLNVLDMDLTFLVDQFLGLNSYILYTTDMIQLNFKIKKYK